MLNNIVIKTYFSSVEIRANNEIYTRSFCSGVDLYSGAYSSHATTVSVPVQLTEGKCRHENYLPDDSSANFSQHEYQTPELFSYNLSVVISCA
jgi:hypothetical protein